MDLSAMIREQAKLGLQSQLDKAVTDGDTATATKIANDMAALAVSTAPKAPPFGQADISAELDKQAWFGIDPRKSAKAVELGKTMDPKKFPSAAAFAEALVKAVNEEFKPAEPVVEENEDETDDERKTREAAAAAAEKKPRRTDGPGESDATARSNARGAAGPWTKLTDAPPTTQKDIKRQADKFVPKNAPKETREAFITKALEVHFATHQRSKGK